MGGWERTAAVLSADSKASGTVLFGNYQPDRSILIGDYVENSLKPSVVFKMLSRENEIQTREYRTVKRDGA